MVFGMIISRLKAANKQIMADPQTARAAYSKRCVPQEFDT
jgi:hypothetical protein